MGSNFVLLKDDQIKPVRFRPYATAPAVTYLPVLSAESDTGLKIHFIEGPEKTINAWYEADGCFEAVTVWHMQLISFLVMAYKRINSGVTGKTIIEETTKTTENKPASVSTELTEAQIKETLRMRIGDVVRLRNSSDMVVTRFFGDNDNPMCECVVWSAQREKIERYELPRIALINRSALDRFRKLQKDTNDNRGGEK